MVSGRMVSGRMVSGRMVSGRMVSELSTSPGDRGRPATGVAVDTNST
jgi:hypothetical protein